MRECKCVFLCVFGCGVCEGVSYRAIDFILCMTFQCRVYYIQISIEALAYTCVQLHTYAHTKITTKICMVAF